MGGLQEVLGCHLTAVHEGWQGSEAGGSLVCTRVTTSTQTAACLRPELPPGWSGGEG